MKKKVVKKSGSGKKLALAALAASAAYLYGTKEGKETREKISTWANKQKPKVAKVVAKAKKMEKKVENEIKQFSNATKAAKKSFKKVAKKKVVKK